MEPIYYDAVPLAVLFKFESINTVEYDKPTEKPSGFFFNEGLRLLLSQEIQNHLLPLISLKRCHSTENKRNVYWLAISINLCT